MKIKRIKLILTILVVLVGFSLLCVAYLIWPQAVNPLSISPSIIVGLMGLFSFTFTIWIKHGKDVWIDYLIDVALPGI